MTSAASNFKKSTTILLMGPPASGKGTIGEMLSKALNLPLISVGDLLRDLDGNSPFYRDIHNAMESGELAPNNHVAEILRHTISKPQYSSGYILDGWARQRSDLDFFDPKPDYVILLDISPKTTIKRISGRRICDVDDKIYNIYTMSREELLSCPGNLTQRDDDKEEVVKNRLKVYSEQTLPSIKYFAQKGNLLKINAERTPEEILQHILSILKNKKND